ncbi:ABC transporter substrate-binding protein [Streptomyces sp. NBC_01340]|uniref:caspase, EACC1-associated type n=1 Tax=unclassified Streptomyces TaxID=2593676 RepID=UPI00225A0C18|nr:MULTISPECIES: ABC transporter substrate-binding protein [unclassified Streptomyces]MCX4454231.1 ABC transporter substrate-binding protein [Streptomyces sp. NBC_01719]MCX4493591.1 ABC transporter substrate-binding protein [Streptomyces sp. NBC_01728]WSI38705.1 ABC transporter substrate-binding protein [Streptomyces sp. NBC_01340]
MTELSNPARSRALLIGSHSFTDPDLEPLPAVARNLDRLAELLRDPSVWGLSADHLSVLTEPERDQALEQVGRLAEEAEDTLLVYYAGHGFVHELSNELYLALPRTDPRRLYTALRYQDIRELLLSPQVRARRKVVILDCCWSGLALHGAMSASGLGGMSDIGGTFVLTATSETRMALAPPGETYTAFTGELIGALEQGVPQAPPLLTMTTLYHHLYDALVAKGRPTPQQRNGNTAGSIAVARNRHRPFVPGPEDAVPSAEESSVDPSAPSPVDAPPLKDPPAGGSRGRLPGLRRRRVVVTASALVVAVLGSLPVALHLIDGGGSDGGSSGGTGSGAGPKTKSSLTVTIGVSAPLSGVYASIGLGIRDSADLAVKKANADNAVPGVTFKIRALDDKSDATTGKRNATEFVADDSVVGVVGPMTSSVAQVMQKVFHDAHLTQISPANSAPALTLGKDWAQGTVSRPYDTYFRTVANDTAQAPAAARYLYVKSKRRKAFVIDDEQTYGASLAESFKKAFGEEGGTVVGEAHVDPIREDFSTQVSQAVNAGADVVYYGGEYDAAGRLSRKLHAASPGVLLAGGDGILSDTYATLAGADDGADICTSGGAVAGSLPSAQTFIKDYKAAGYTSSYGSYGGYAYDATSALIQAFKSLHVDPSGTVPSTKRESLRASVQNVDFDGVMGKVGFDANGDAVSQTVTVYRLSGGTWKPV